MVWSTLPDGFHDYYNARWYEYTGVPAGSTDGEGWNGMFHPDDQDRAWGVWRDSLATGKPYEIEYRLRRAGLRCVRLEKAPLSWQEFAGHKDLQEYEPPWDWFFEAALQ